MMSSHLEMLQPHESYIRERCNYLWIYDLKHVLGYFPQVIRHRKIYLYAGNFPQQIVQV